MNKKIGIVSIGQSPRDDITNVIANCLGDDVEIVESGALDDLNLNEIKSLEPTCPNNVLVTRLANGHFVYVDKSKIIELLQQKVIKVEEKNVDLIILGCTGKFPQLKSSVPLLVPEQIFPKVVNSIFDGGKLGVIMPTEEQEERGKQKWGNEDRELLFSFSSPYGSIKEIKEAATSLKEKNVDMILMDCMGFNETQYRVIRKEAKVPTLLPSALMGKIASWILY